MARVLIGARWLWAVQSRAWVNFHAEAVAIAGAFVGGAALIVQRSSFYVPRFWLLWVGCAGAVALLQWWVVPGIYLGDIVIALIFFGALTCAVAIGWHVGQSPTPLSGLAFGALALAASLSAFVGILQWLSLSEILGVFAVHIDYGERAMGNVAQPNQLGTLLLMGLCANAYFFDRHHFSRWTFGLLASVFTLALALTQSRTALLGATALAIFAFSPGVAPLRIRRQWVVCWALIFWLMFLLAPAINDWLMIGGGRNVPLTSSNSRDIIWKQVGYAILQNPWVGYGWNRTATAHMASAAALPGELTFTYAHNAVLDFLAWYGVPIGLGLMGSMTYWFWSRWRKLNTPQGIFAFAALIPFVLHSLLEFPFAYGYFLVTAGVLVGMVEAAVRAPCKRVGAFIAAPVLTGLAVLGAIAGYEYLKVEDDFRVARFANMRIGRMPEGFTYSEIHLLTQMGEMLQASRMRPSPGMSSAEIELLMRVAQRFPYGALTYRYVEALALNNQIGAAREELRVLRGLYGSAYYKAIRVEIMERGGQYPELLLLLED